MASNIVRFDELRYITYTALATPSAFVAFGFVTSQSTPAPFDHAMRVLNFKNTTDADIYISYDGVTINDIVAKSTFDLYDLTSDQDANEMFRYQSGTQVYAASVAMPTKGYIGLTSIYGKGE